MIEYCKSNKFRTSLVQVWWVEEEISSKAFGDDDGLLTMIMIIFVYVGISTVLYVNFVLLLMMFDPFGFQRGIYRIWLIHFDCSQYRVRVFYWGRYPRTNTTGSVSYSTDNPRDQSWKRTVKSILFSLKHISIQCARRGRCHKGFLLSLLLYYTGTISHERERVRIRVS